MSYRHVYLIDLAFLPIYGYLVPALDEVFGVYAINLVIYEKLLTAGRKVSG